jgi:autotransporter-associated beta strand protein
MSVIMVYDASNGGGHLFGARKEQQAFQRNINHPDMPIFGEVSAGNTVLKYANVWVDGVPRGKGASGMKAGCQIISFTAPGPFYLGSIGIRELTSTKAGGGGQRYGEILIYDHVLTDEERSSTEAYLAAKWWGEPMAGYTVDGKPNMPGQQSDSSVALTVPSEETLSVGYLAGEGGVVKTGSGTLELMGSTSELSGDIDVREGTVKYTVRTLDVDTLPVTGGLLAHFDASDESSFIKNANGGVIGWKAKAAAAKYGELVAESYFKDSSGNPRAGTYLANELNGRGVLDCGAHGNSGVGFVFPETISNVNHVVMLFGSQNGGGFILGEINDGVSNEIWHRESPWNEVSSAIFNNDGRGLNLYVEGIKKEKVTEKNVLNGGYQILEVSLDTWSANKSVSGFGLDRITFPDRAGGQRYAEVMIYDHVLSAEERLALLIYLNNRWRNANYVGSGVFDAMYLDRANAGRVTVADGATFDLNGFTQTTEMLGGSGTIKGGNVIVTDEVLASFGDDALSVEGTLTFSGAGAIVFPADWTGGYGRWKLFSATKIEGNVRDWVGTGIVNGKEYNAKLSVSGNTVYLNINSPGTEIIIR